MFGNTESLKREREIASTAVKKLRSAVRSEINNTTRTITGLASRTGGAGSRFKYGRLQRVTISAPAYIFMQNFGFEGKKSNGVNQRLNATDVFAKSIERANILEDMANDISELRLDQVSAIIRLNTSNNG